MARSDYDDPVFEGTFSSGDETHRFGKEPQAGTAPSGSVGEARFAPGTILAGRYRLVAMLGRGGMGEVYRAEDLKLGEPVALKFLPEELNFDAVALERFHREVRVARQITHRNVCRVYDIGEADGTHFLSMEYIDGEDLSTLLRRIGRLPQGKALQLARQLCRGLAAAHESGVLHRDLKPANVMIDGQGQAKITDFGLARLLEELRQSATSQLVGTPAYMAPEQIRGQESTPRSDLFSLGMVLYEMTTGHRPFPEVDWLHLIARGGREVPPTEPTEYVDSLPLDVASVLLRCLEEDPADRPASVLEVLASLPGGDPLRAALEAGETPSPEMVAGVSEQRALAPWQAAALYAVFALFLVVFHLTADQTTLLGMVEPRIHREALEDRARTLLHDVGWDVRHDPPADSFGAFWFEESRVEGFEGATVSNWRARAKSRPALITFYFRSSDSSLFDPRVDLPQPSIPESRPGDALVVFDPEGRLEYLRLDPRPGAPAGSAPDWTQPFAWADLELATFRELPPPPLNSGGLDLPVHSQRRAWVGRVDGTDLRVDAASFGSLPVFFHLAQNHEQTPSDHTLIAKWLFVAFFLLLGLAGFAAFRNVRQRRGDIRGALTTAGLVAGATLLAEILWQQGGSGLADVRWLDGIVTTVAYRAFVVMIFYLSMEPAVRSWAPALLVSWTRLVRGRGSDSRVARDTLMGLVVGVGLTSSVLYVEKLWDPTPLVIFDLSSKLSGVGPALGLLGWLSFIAVTGTFAVALLQASLERWLKRRWLAGVLLALAVALLAQSAMPAVLPLTVAVFGVLAAIVAWIAFGLVLFFPATGDPTVWWAWPEAWLMSSLLLMVGVVAYRQAVGLGTVARSA